MSDIAIRVENLSKLYHIGATQPRHDTLRDALVGVLPRIPRMKKTEEIRGNPSNPWQKEDTDLWALRDVSFDVKQGEVVGIIGRNGAGKSTLLKILSRITEPTSGRVQLHGRVASLLEVGTGFHPELTGRENIYLNGAILGMKRREIERKFDEIVAFAEIERFLDTPVKRYSSGMYVRLAFAVAAHLEPEILLVDEVLAVGDAEFQKKCLGKMGDVAKQGRTVLFVSHNMTAITSMCSIAILLNKGCLDREGKSRAVVNDYLSNGRNSTAEILWSEQSSAPGNDFLRIRSVRVRNADGIVTSDIDIAHPFEVEIEYWNRSKGAKLGTTINLISGEGIWVLSTVNNRDRDWYGKGREKGLYRSVCCVPGNLLNNGNYKIGVIVWADNYWHSHREDEVVEINVHDTGVVRGDYYGDWPGVIRPDLDWRTEAISTEP